MSNIKKEKRIFKVDSTKINKDNNKAEIEKYSKKIDYDLPIGEEVTVDVINDKIVDKKVLTPFEKIQNASKEQGIDILEPNPNCKKCYGRGYVSINVKTQLPNPCMCIFTKEQKKSLNLVKPQKNRAERRKEERFFRKLITKARNNKNNKKNANILDQLKKINKVFEQKKNIVIDTETVKETVKETINEKEKII